MFRFLTTSWVAAGLIVFGFIALGIGLWPMVQEEGKYRPTVFRVIEAATEVFKFTCIKGQGLRADVTVDDGKSGRWITNYARFNDSRWTNQKTIERTMWCDKKCVIPSSSGYPKFADRQYTWVAARTTYVDKPIRITKATCM